MDSGFAFELVIMIRELSKQSLQFIEKDETYN